jgi:hypothetical protein
MAYLAMDSAAASELDIDIYTDTIFTVVTGPRIDLAIDLIARFKQLFEHVGITFQDKNTVVHLGKVKIEAFPSHHTDSMRGLPNVKVIMLDEADYFPKNEQQEARTVAERYIGKSDSRIIMVSTPADPTSMFFEIEHQKDCIYERCQMGYQYGIGTIYSPEDLKAAMASSSFEREYNLAYQGTEGNLLSPATISEALAKGKTVDVDGAPAYTASRSMGLDPAWGSSAFGIVVTQFANGRIEVLYADQIEKASFEQALNRCLVLIKKFSITRQFGSQIYCDSANPELIRSLKEALGDRTDWDVERRWYEQHSKGYNFEDDWNVVPINFNQRHKEMVSHLKRLMENNGGSIAIPESCNKLVTSLRTAVVTEWKLDKTATVYNDIFDAFRLSLMLYGRQE